MSVIGKNNEDIAGESVLDETADIYKQERERETFKDTKGFTNKIIYIFKYYKWLLAIIAGALLIFFTLVIPALTNKKAQFTAAILNNLNSQDYKEDTLRKEFGAQMKYESDKDIDLQYFYMDANQQDTSTNMAISTRMYSKQLDVMISDKAIAEFYTMNESILDLKEFLPDDLKETLKDKFITMETEDGKKVSSGLDLSDAPLLKKTGYSFDHPVLSVVGNTQHKDAVIAFIRYAYGLNN